MSSKKITPESIASTEAQPTTPTAKKAKKVPASKQVEAMKEATEDRENLILASLAVLTNPMPAEEWEALYNKSMEVDDQIMVEALSRVDVLKADSPVDATVDGEPKKNARKSNQDGKALTLRIRQEVIKNHALGLEPSMKTIIAALADEFGELNDFTLKTVFNHAIATIRAIDSLGYMIGTPAPSEPAS